MIISVTCGDPSTLHAGRPGRAGEVAVLEPADVSRLHVELTGLEPADANQILADWSLGYLQDAGIAWISVERLRHVVSDVAQTWADDFAGAVRYAGTRGWLSSDGTHLMAHVVLRPHVPAAASSSDVPIDPPTSGALR